MNYDEMKEKILNEIKNNLKKFEDFSIVLQKLQYQIGHIDLENISDREKLDYTTTLKTDENVNKFNILVLLSMFMDKPHDDDICSALKDEMNRYRAKRIEREEAIKFIEQYGKHQENTNEDNPVEDSNNPQEKKIKFNIKKIIKKR